MWDIEIRNIGGIRAGETEFHEGVNVVQAENWQGKSSLLAAVQTVMGTTGLDSEQHPLTEGESSGYVQLDAAERSSRVALSREGEAVSRNGDPFLDHRQDRVSARLFAFLGENNPVRAAVKEGGDLGELLRRPLDLENIDEQIVERQRERKRIENELESAKRAARELPDVQEDLARLGRELEELRADREQMDTGSESDDEDVRGRLSNKRALRDRLEGQIDTLVNKIEHEEERLAEKEHELDELSVPNEPEFEADIESKRERIGTLRRQINLLEDVYSTNKRVIEESFVDIVTEVDRGIAEDEITCWVSGDTTTSDEIEQQLNALEEKISTRKEERSELRDQIARIEQQRDEYESKKQAETRLESEIRDLESRIKEDRAQVEDHRSRLEEVTEEIAALEERIEETNDQLAEIESNIKVQEQHRDEKQEELDRLESEADRRTELQEEYDELTAEIKDLRERKRQKQMELAEQFDDAMADIINRFDPGFDGARLEPKTDDRGEITDFNLVVAREGREASLDTLSEGELELIGIVTALAGYKTFDVNERVPAILLDGLGSLTNAHIHDLVDYLRGEADYLVTTVFPDAGEFDGYVVKPDEWEVVSDQQSATA